MLVHGEIGAGVRSAHASRVQELNLYSKSNGKIRVFKQVSDIFNLKSIHNNGIPHLIR